MTGAADQHAPGIAARRVAFDALNAVFFKRRSLDEVFDARSATGAGFLELEPRDRAFVRLLVSLVLKRAGECDDRLAPLLHDPIESLTPPQLLTILRMGLVQLAFLETPAHAVVDTSVSLATAVGLKTQSSLVNAVLRRAAREGMTPLAPRDAGRRMLPEWLWRSWVDDYGVETALACAAALLDDAPVDFTLRDTSPGVVNLWAEKLGATVLPTGSLRKSASGFVPSLDGFEQGAWWVQNAAAAMPVKVLAPAVGMTVVDLCAAPGGKTAQLAAAGAAVIALDRSAPRMQRLTENMARLKLDVTTVVADGAVWQPLSPVDAVLLDAPCTATGTLRHQPDALWLKEPADQVKLAALQEKLIDNALAMLRPGGIVVYCTCSLQKAEGEAQIAAALARHAGRVARLPIAADLLPEALTDEGDLRILPQHLSAYGGMDGFFVARLQKLP